MGFLAAGTNDFTQLYSFSAVGSALDDGRRVFSGDRLVRAGRY